MTRRKLTIEELGRPETAAFKAQRHHPLALVLDNIRSLNNVGSLLRTADAMNVAFVALCGCTGTPPSPEIHKTALGAENSVEWRHYESTLDAMAELRSLGYTLAALEQTHNSTQLHNFRLEPKRKYALIVGNEVKGVAQEAVDAADLSLEIPQWGTKHSLNVSVAAGMALWEMARQITANTTAI